MVLSRIGTVLMVGVFTARFGAVPLLAAESSTSGPGFSREIQPFLSEFCYGCHGEERQKADLNLSLYRTEAGVLKDRKTWEKVLHNLRIGEMPPKNKPQPSLEQRDQVTAWIESTIFKVDCDNPDPGRVTIRRLNREEYNNTIRDLLGMDFQPAANFPADDTGYGFDNIGDVLSLSPMLLEKYLAAAEKILDAAIVTEPQTNGPTHRFEAERDLKSDAPGGPVGKYLELNREGEAFRNHPFRHDGEYTVRVRAFGQQAGPEPARMEVRVDGKAVKTFDVKAVENRPQIYEVKVHLKAGSHRIGAAYINNYVNQDDPDPKKRGDRNLLVDYLEIAGPPGSQPLPETHTRIFVRKPTPSTRSVAAREIIAQFATRAYRRPLAKEEVDRLLGFFEQTDRQLNHFEKSIQRTLQAVLVSPHFLFRGELQPEPDNPRRIHAINEYALASRLSYFLWSSMPDEDLFAQAQAGTLRRNLETQVRRMLKDSRSRELVQNFAGQWLQLRNLDIASPARRDFPDFDNALRGAMRKETELFFEHVMREDRSVLDFVDADYTFVNERLGKHYAMEGISGNDFQKVSLQGTPRGGVLTHASVLTITSNPTRTSPVKRGLFVLENLLGYHPPPPPPDVPELPEGRRRRIEGTLRERMEQHRADPGCASCHAKMDPLGFGLENFDGVGAWREKEGRFPIDASGELVTGEKFNGPAELRRILAESKREEYLKCLSEKMLTYALGRGLEYYDKCAVDQILKRLSANEDRFSALILGVVKSTPFQMRRGEGEGPTS